MTSRFWTICAIPLLQMGAAAALLVMTLLGERAAEKENHSVEAVDLKAGQVVTRVAGLKQPQRIALIPLTAEIRRRALLSSTSGIPEGQELIVTNRADLQHRRISVPSVESVELGGERQS